MGNDGLGYRYVTGPLKKEAIRGKFYTGVPLERIDDMKKGESLKYRPIVNFYDYSPDFGNIRHEGGIAFNSGKKPIKMIENLLNMSNLKNNDLVMDFFSGSGSTAHSVLQYHFKKNQNIKFILIQLSENTYRINRDGKEVPLKSAIEAYNKGFKTIAEIGKERIRRAGKKIKEEQEAKNNQLKFGEEPIDTSKLDIGFRVYKTDTSNMKDVYYHPEDLKQKQLEMFESNIKEGRTPDDLLTQVILDLGLELNLPIEKKEMLGNTVFIVQTNALVACFDNNINFKIIDEIADLKPFKVVFKDAGFSKDKDRINLEERFKRLSPETVITIL